MCAADGREVGVADRFDDRLRVEQSNLVGAAMGGELLEDGQLGLGHGRDEGSGLGGPESRGGRGVEPALTCLCGDRLRGIGLAGETGVAEVLDGRAHGAVGTVDDVDAAALAVGEECGGQAEDA